MQQYRRAMVIVLVRHLSELQSNLAAEAVNVYSRTDRLADVDSTAAAAALCTNSPNWRCSKFAAMHGTQLTFQPTAEVTTLSDPAVSR